MFELEQHVRSWGDYLRSKGMKEADVLELESHLLDQIDDLVKSGLSEEEAFIISVKRLGNVNTISEEYSKINTENLWKHLLLDPADPTAKARSRKQIALIILLSFLAGTVAKIPAMFGIQTQDVVYFKNLSFFVLPFIAFFITVKHGRVKMFWPLLAVYTTSCVVVNLLSPYRPSQTDILTEFIYRSFSGWLRASPTQANGGLARAHELCSVHRRVRHLWQPAQAGPDGPYVHHDNFPIDQYQHTFC